MSKKISRAYIHYAKAARVTVFSFLTFLMLSISSGLNAQTGFPDNGAVIVLPFNGSLKDSRCKLTFVDEKQAVKKYVAGVGERAKGAVMFNEGGYSGVKLFGDPYDFGSMLLTFRIDSLSSYGTYSLIGLYPQVLKLDENLQIQYDAMRESGKEDHYHFDMGIETGKWVTVGAVWDFNEHTVTYYANGKKCSIVDYRIEKKSYGSEITGNIGYSGGVSFDELRMYNRALSEQELLAFCSPDGKAFDSADEKIDQALLKMNWIWAIIQLSVAALCLFVLNRPKKQLSPVTVDSIKVRNGKTETAFQHLNVAFSYWGGLSPDDETGGLKTHYYPESRKDMKASYASFRNALDTGCVDEDFIETSNLYVSVYNAAHKRVFNGKWWVFLVAIVCVYVRGIVPEFSFGLLDNDSLIGFPDGFMNQMWYLSMYMLPGVLISAIAYYAASFGVRYRIKAGEAIQAGDLKSQSQSKQNLLFAGIAVGGGLLSIVGGAFAGVIAIVLIIAAIVFVGTSIVAKHGTVKEVWINRNNGHREIREGGNPMAIGVVLAIFAGVLFAMYFVSGIIIFLFNLVFLYKFVQNHIVKT
jgi:hypothetical protein